MTTTFMHSGYRRTSRGHKTVNGVGFASYQTGITRFAMISDDGQMIVTRNYQRSTFQASVIIRDDMVSIGQRYRTETAAMKAAIKAHRS